MKKLDLALRSEASRHFVTVPEILTGRRVRRPVTKLRIDPHLRA